VKVPGASAQAGLWIRLAPLAGDMACVLFKYTFLKDCFAQREAIVRVVQAHVSEQFK
jgi:hypothetical protein